MISTNRPRNFTVPGAGLVDLTLTSNRFDLVSVGLTLLDASQQPISQPGDTPDARGYHVLPPFFDMESANFTFTHKDSTAFRITHPW